MWWMKGLKYLWHPSEQESYEVAKGVSGIYTQQQECVYN